MSEINPVRFFLGANTPNGFVSLFNEVEQPNEPWHSFLIKGGPGCGKSTFMKKVAAAYGASCPAMELCPCSSDPDSLDAVILPEEKLSLMDATAPHAADAAIPALRQSILAFGDYLDGLQLREYRREIEAICASTPEYYKLAVSYLRAAHAFLQNSYELASTAINKEKIRNYVRRFAAKNLRPTGRISSEKSRFLSSICSKGIVALEQSPTKLCSKLILIDDDYGAAAHELLSSLRKLALKNGHDIISCYCPMFPGEKLEHLLIPSAGIGFVTANHFHPMKGTGSIRRLHSRRFQDQEVINLKKSRFLYNRKAAQTLIEQAIFILNESKELHDRLEKIYIGAMDFDGLNLRYPQLLQMIKDYSLREK